MSRDCLHSPYNQTNWSITSTLFYDCRLRGRRSRRDRVSQVSSSLVVVVDCRCRRCRRRRLRRPLARLLLLSFLLRIFNCVSFHAYLAHLCTVNGMFVVPDSDSIDSGCA